MRCSATSKIWHMLPTVTKLPALRPYTRASTCSRHNRAARVSLRCHNYPKIPTLSRSPMEVVMPAANGRAEYTRQAPLTCLARLCVGPVGTQAPCSTNAPKIGLGQAAPSHHDLYMNQQLRTGQHAKPAFCIADSNDLQSLASQRITPKAKNLFNHFQQKRKKHRFEHCHGEAFITSSNTTCETCPNKDAANFDPERS